MMRFEYGPVGAVDALVAAQLDESVGVGIDRRLLAVAHRTRQLPVPLLLESELKGC